MCIRDSAYVDSALAYLKSDFDLKFYDSESTSKYAIVMQFVDALAMHERLWAYETVRLPLGALFYLIIGGKDLMCAFSMEYNQMEDHFRRNPLHENREEGV